MHYSVVLLVMWLFQLYMYKKWTNPAVLMNMLWFLIVLVYEFDVIHLNEISLFSFWIIIIGVLSFDIGVAIINKVSFVIEGKRIISSYDKDNYFIRYNLIIVLGIISILVYLPDTLNSIRLLLSGNRFTYLRTINTTIKRCRSKSGD